MFFVGDHLGLIYLLNIFVSTITVFFAPAEAAMIPMLVPRRQLLSANGIFTLTLNAAFALGFALVGPAGRQDRRAAGADRRRRRAVLRRRRRSARRCRPHRRRRAPRPSTGRGRGREAEKAVGSVLAPARARVSATSAPTARSAGR